MEFRIWIKSLLHAYHGGMTTYQVASKFDIPVEDVKLWLEKEASGDLNFILFPES